MAHHQLGLDIIETSNQKVLRILDASIYETTLEVDCPELLITPPGFENSASIDATLLTQGFNLTLTACQLGLQKHNCDSVHNLIPDGIYAIKYSVSPNDVVFVEYNHLRTVEINERINEALCNLKLKDYTATHKTKEALQEIMEISGYVKAAKVAVESKFDPVKGMALYDYAIKRLEKIDCINCS